jgi:tetratricopeptide (TPR) repeat protein
MSFSFLVGPVGSAAQAAPYESLRRGGDCRTFGPDGADVPAGPDDPWDRIAARLPEGWRPDAVLVRPADGPVPVGLLAAPVPVVAVATGWPLLWHGYRRLLPWFDLVLADLPGSERLSAAGRYPAQPVPVGGLDAAPVDPADTPKDIDVLFASNLPPAALHEHLPLLWPLAAVGERWAVTVARGVYGEAYRALLRRARVVVNTSQAGECNTRAVEAAAAGALLFQEADNREVPELFRPGEEFVPYTPADLPALLGHHLGDEAGRARLAAAGTARARGYAAGPQWEAALAAVGGMLPVLAERAARRPDPASPAGVLARAVMALCRPGPADPAAVAALARLASAHPDDANLHNFLGAAEATRPGATPDRVRPFFERAVERDPQHALARLNLAQALRDGGRPGEAVGHLRTALDQLQTAPELGSWVWDHGLYPAGCDLFRVEWERAAWHHPTDPHAEMFAKRRLLRWRAAVALAELTDDPIAGYEAYLARSDLAPSAAALGRVLARAGRHRDAAAYLRLALAQDPTDAAAARGLHAALGAAGDRDRQAVVARERAHFARVMPGLVPAEAWFRPAADAEATPAATRPPARPRGRERVSLTMIVRDEERRLPDCLASAADLADEVVVADTGSADRTREVAARFGAKVVEFPWADDFAAARNEALRHATGSWVWWLDADDRLDPANRDRARALFARLGGEPDAYVMKVRSPLDPAGKAARELDQVRLFPNRPGVRWRYRIHEQIMPAVREHGGDLRWSEVTIDHLGYADPAVRRRKLDRNLRLLEMEDADRPGDAYTLFNLGWTTLDLGRPRDAVGYLERSLAKARPTASFLRKLYVLMAKGHRAAGDPGRAPGTCRAALERFPDDLELLVEAAALMREAGDLAGAEAALNRVLTVRPKRYLASTEVGLQGYKARHLLAGVVAAGGRAAEAEGLWRRALAERPDFTPAALGLAHLLAREGRWDDLLGVADALAADPAARDRAEVFRARAHLARGEWAAARAVLEGVVARSPGGTQGWLLLSRALLQEGRDWEAAERALTAVLERQPGHAEAEGNLRVLRERRAAAAG